MQGVKEVTLIMNTTEKITFKLPCTIKELHAFDRITIEFHDNNQQYYILYNNFADGAISRLQVMLRRALNNNLEKHPSITHNIGYLWNEELAEKPGLTYTQLEGTDHWVGIQNLLWSTTAQIRPVVSAWLYNNATGDIVFEVTPTYPWHFSEPTDADKDYMEYEDFMKDYKPLLIRTISTEVAQQWLVQAQDLLKHIEKNNYPNAIDA